MAVEGISATFGFGSSSVGKTGVSLLSNPWTAALGKSLTALAGKGACASDKMSQANTEFIMTEGGMIKKVCQFVNCEVNSFSAVSGVFGKSSSRVDLSGGGTDSSSGRADLTDSGAGTSSIANPNRQEDLAREGVTSLAERGNLMFEEAGAAFHGSFMAWDNISHNTILAGKGSGNMVINLVNMCIPGLIVNLNEYRQIKCRYALCLLDDVPNGTPMQACKDAREFASCVYIFSNIFGAFNIAAYWDNIINTVKEIFVSPVALIGSYKFFCQWSCLDKSGVSSSWYDSVCVSLNQLNRWLELFKNVMSIIDFFNDPLPADFDHCAVLEEKAASRGEGAGDQVQQGQPSEQRPGTAWG